MTAPRMRDHAIAEEIAAVETMTLTLKVNLGEIVLQAERQGATAHAALYESVRSCLASAQKQLGRAHGIMLNAEPEDYDGDGVCAEVKAALEGDSNDAEHDALVSVAGYLGISWDPDAADGGLE